MRRIVWGLVVGLVLLSEGCASCDSHKAFLNQLRDNLANDIGPKYKHYLDADTTRPQELKDNDYGVVQDSIDSIDRALATAKEGASE